MKLSSLVWGSVLLGVAGMTHAEDLGLIGKIKEDGRPVIYKFVDEYPPEDVRTKYAWVTVIAWKYDGANQNGMPSDEDNRRMIVLEDTIDQSLADPGYARHAYSRTGNDLKEFVYYISDREEFMAGFNEALREHAPYPIEINFYKDQAWEDFQSVLTLFDRAGSH